MHVAYDFNEIILSNYTLEELHRLHELAEALDELDRQARSVSEQGHLIESLMWRGRSRGIADK